MAIQLSAETEQYLESVVAGGLFPTREAALEAAVQALRAAAGAIPMVPPEHMALVEAAIESKRGSRPLLDADWERLRQRARDAAAGKRVGTTAPKDRE